MKHLNLSILLIVILFSACDSSLDRANPFDPESDDTMIGAITGVISPVSSKADISAQADGMIIQTSTIRDNGRFTLDLLPEGNYTLIISASGFVTDSSRANIEVVPEQTLDVGTIYLNSTSKGTIAGVVEPYDDNTVVKLMRNGSTLETASLTDAGTFFFSELTPGTYDVEVSLVSFSTYTASSVNVTAGISTNLGTIILNSSTLGSITGIISPILSGIKIYLISNDTSIIEDSTTINSLSGQYLFRDLSPGVYNLEITAPTYATSSLFGIAVIGGQTNEGNNAILRATGSLLGSVYPVSSNALVEAMQGEDVIEDTRINSVDGSYTLSGLGAGLYDVRISADGRITDESTVQVRVSEGGNSAVDRVYLSQVGSNVVYGIITDNSSGASIGGVNLEIQGINTTTDPLGYFSFYELESGIYNVQIAKSGYFSTLSAIVIPQTGSTKSNISLISAGSLTGIVTDSQSSNPIADARLEIDGGDFLGFTNSSGEYQFTGVPQGSHTIIASKAGFGSDVQEIIIISGAASTHNIGLNPLSLSTGSISGNVKDVSTNLNVEGVSIVVAGQISYTNSSGNFSIQYIPTGTHSVLLEHPDYISISESVQISVNSNTVQNALLTNNTDPGSLPTGTVSGSFIDGSTGGVIDYSANVAVYLTSSYGSYAPLRQGVIANGQFSILNYAIPGNPNYGTPNIPIGTYHLWFSDFSAKDIGIAGYLGFDMVVDIGEGANVINPVLSRLSSIGGIVKDLYSGIPLSGVTVMNATTDANGSFFKNRLDPNISEVSFNLDGYYQEENEIQLISGEHLALSIDMVSLPKISGRVIDSSSSTPIPGVEISSSSSSGSIISASDGTFEIEFSGEGGSSISFAKAGYNSYATGVYIPYTGTIELEVSLVSL